MTLTISYLTSRIEPHVEWFFSSLAAQGGTNLPINIIDFHADAEGRRESFAQLAEKHGLKITHHITPMPTVWQGPHRLTKVDCFAAANCRNTAIAACATDYIAFVDDVSVLMPGWLTQAKLAMTREGATLGAYEKRRNVVVDDHGNVIGGESYQGGIDHRVNVLPNGGQCGGGWFYCSSVVAKTNDLLKVNGFETLCDGMGSEDYICGIMLNNAGVPTYFDPAMKTLECETSHHVPADRKYRWDVGQSPNDKSHAILARANASQKWAENACYAPHSLAGVRQRFLAGEPFLPPNGPDRDWFDNTPLTELPPAHMLPQ
jgi:hypothetical protein